METEALQLSLFDEQGLAETTTAVYPGERTVLCRNPLRARESAYNRERLLTKTEEALEKIVLATRRKGNPLRSMKAISLRVGKIIGKWKMEKHFNLDIKEGFFSYQRNADSIASEASLDGMYAIRSSLRLRKTQLQAAQRCRAGLPEPQDRGPQSRAHPPLQGPESHLPRLPVHAGLLRGMAHEAASGSDTFCRR